MKRTSWFKNFFKGLFNYVVSEWQILIMVIFFFIGMIIATILVKNGNPFALEYAYDQFNEYTVQNLTYTFIKIAINYFLYTLPVFIVVYFAGLFVPGAIVAIAAVTYSGFRFGAVLGYFYLTYSVKGFLFSLCMILPHTLIYMIGLILIAREAFVFSLRLLSHFFPLTCHDCLSVEFKKYSIRFFIALMILVFSSFIGLINFKIFFSCFNF